MKLVEQSRLDLVENQVQFDSMKENGNGGGMRMTVYNMKNTQKMG